MKPATGNLGPGDRENQIDSLRSLCHRGFYAIPEVTDQ